MKILAIDTSSDICSVAISEDRKIIDKIENQNVKEHSIVLMPMIKEILKRNFLKLDDINLLACSVGPGSFTGIRIGLATIKAFADVKYIPVVGVNSLEAIAYSIRAKEKIYKVASIIDAKNDNVYFGIYKFENERGYIYKNISTEDILDIVKYMDVSDELYIVGNIGREKIENLLSAKIEEDKYEAKQENCNYHFVKKLDRSLAESIAIAGFDKYKLELLDKAKDLKPMYLRRSQAEREKEGNDIELYFLSMTKTDIEKISLEYNYYPNLWNVETFKEDTKNSEYIVAKTNNEIVGFISFTTILDEIEINNIVTKKEYRNKGIASSILSYIIRTKEYNKINLEVNKNNPAIRLYKKFGFKEVGRREKYYQGKDDAILMTLK